MTKSIKFISLLSFPVFFLMSSCGNSKNASTSTQNQVIDYKSFVLAPQSVTLKSHYPATIEGQQDIEIRPKIEGFIEEIYIDEGASVKKGQKLFKINAPQYEQEVRTGQAAIKIAEASVKSAQMDVDKIRPLVEKNIISKYELESAEFALQAKQAQLAQAKASLANASINLAYTIVTSPVTGIIGALPYKIGSLVNGSTPSPLTTVSNISTVYAYFSINEKQLLEIGSQTGKSMQASLTTLPAVSLLLANGSRFPEKGKIEATTGTINSMTGSIRVRATFPNPNAIVRSGSSGVVEIPLTLDSAFVIPQKVTYEIQGKKFVYVVNADNTVTSKSIVVMDNHDGQFYVVTEGLTSGDQIVLEGLGTLRDGLLIKPVLISNADSLYQGLHSQN